jgi:hypothetical protein
MKNASQMLNTTSSIPFWLYGKWNFQEYYKKTSKHTYIAELMCFSPLFCTSMILLQKKNNAHNEFKLVSISISIVTMLVNDSHA